MKPAEPIELDAAGEGQPELPRAEFATAAALAGPEGVAPDELCTVAPEALQILASMGC
ncbi:MAG TPA: hypothetical protein VMU03_01865 [Gammaproteobacteria bacterium]|nr:hypothetical protein [Gammaproteobacteria bacterium]